MPEIVLVSPVAMPFWPVPSERHGRHLPPISTASLWNSGNSASGPVTSVPQGREAGRSAGASADEI